MYQFLLLIHVACFALWMGAVAASLLIVHTLEPRLTGTAGNVTPDADLLRAYIRREVKFVDVVFAGVLISGIMLAQLYTGWTPWVLAKIGLFIAQFVATMAYIQVFIRPLTYPCPPHLYRRWYGLFAVSLSFFTVTLLVVFFGR
ncbi:MAG: hypothetical protein ACUVSY_02015 [Roseiflexus sp.]